MCLISRPSLLLLVDPSRAMELGSVVWREQLVAAGHSLVLAGGSAVLLALLGSLDFEVGL